MEIAGIAYMKFVFSLAFVLALIWAVSLAAKRFGMGNRGPVRRGTGRRLEIIESLPLDAKRRMVLVRRDGLQHLILLGAESEEVVESGITAPTEAATAAASDRSAPVTPFKLPAIVKS